MDNYFKTYGQETHWFLIHSAISSYIDDWSEKMDRYENEKKKIMMHLCQLTVHL